MIGIAKNIIKAAFHIVNTIYFTPKCNIGWSSLNIFVERHSGHTLEPPLLIVDAL
jgi:hypothetical protein